jgi:hypothetical protein
MLIATLDWEGNYEYLLFDNLLDEPFQFRNFKPPQKFKPNPLYTVENTIRLVIIGTSIAFFIQFLILEIVTAFFAIGTLISTRISECYQKFGSGGNSTLEFKKEKEIIYRS